MNGVSSEAIKPPTARALSPTCVSSCTAPSSVAPSGDRLEHLSRVAHRDPGNENRYLGYIHAYYVQRCINSVPVGENEHVNWGCA